MSQETEQRKNCSTNSLEPRAVPSRLLMPYFVVSLSPFLPYFCFEYCHLFELIGGFNTRPAAVSCRYSLFSVHKTLTAADAAQQPECES